MRGLLGLATLLLVTTPAAAATDAEIERAAAHYEAGRGAFLAGDFARARAEFGEAYKLDPSPILIYNLGRASEELGDDAAAVEHYRVYLARAHDADDRGEVIERIARLEAALRAAELDRVVVPPALESTPASESQARARAAGGDDDVSLYPYGLTATTLGIAGIATGVFFGLASEEATREHRRARDGAELRRTWDKAHARAENANLAYGIGGGLLALGLTLTLIEVFDDDGPRLAAQPQAGGGHFVFSHSF